jgi:hypothetical protein
MEKLSGDKNVALTDFALYNTAKMSQKERLSQRDSKRRMTTLLNKLGQIKGPDKGEVDVHSWAFKYITFLSSTCWISPTQIPENL